MQYPYVRFESTDWKLVAFPPNTCSILDSSIRSSNDIITFRVDILFKKKRPSLSQHTCFDSSNLGEAQRIGHGQVPVQRYTAEEGDADVDVGVEDEAE